MRCLLVIRRQLETSVERVDTSKGGFPMYSQRGRPTVSEDRESMNCQSMLVSQPNIPEYYTQSLIHGYEQISSASLPVGFSISIYLLPLACRILVPGLHVRVSESAGSLESRCCNRQRYGADLSRLIHQSLTST